MKVDFIISSLGGGGAERVFALMANSLSKSDDYKISVIILLDGEEVYQFEPNVKRIKLKQIKYIPSHTFRSIINLIRYYYYESNRPDVIVSFLTLNNLMAIIVAKLFSIKIIAQEHTHHLRFMKGRKILTNFTKKHIYKWADAVTVLTKFDVNYYKSHNVKVSVMPNPCSFRAITNFSIEREKVILAVGGLNRYHLKGFDNLIHLIGPVLKKHPDWRLKILGRSDKDDLEYLKNIAIQNNIINKIIFTGFISNVSDVMKNSSIFVLSSRNEGLPMVLIEAMSQGMACIAYNCKTGPSDIIEDDINGLLIEDQNMLKMQNGLDELIKNEPLRKRLSIEGIKSLEKYHVSEITKRYEILFNKVINA
ncbi:glycosyltransferase family 4 protein [Winogradskyella sp. F6397]|uniref:Glycosyltransferase family 4 protein n=1 Tax=Winogradskyella marina TaxID=2785530 RepID=A0ABS0EGL6_9FLAO|nr:glycosyltransferase family 4 protein [Winogradskyella marina]MBF8149559.1 glycosyltransferase family 4 protein [Winogradskyella marina]